MIRAGWWSFLLLLTFLGLAAVASRGAPAVQLAAADSVAVSPASDDGTQPGVGDQPGDMSAEGEGSGGEGEVDEDAPDPLHGGLDAARIPPRPTGDAVISFAVTTRSASAEPPGLYRPPRA